MQDADEPDSAVPPAIQPFARQEAPSVVVARHLLQYLLSGHFSHGDRIPSERQLADSLNVGRASIREATKSLSLLGLLTIRQGDGTYLTQSTSSLLPEAISWGMMLEKRRLTDLMEVRINLDGFSAALAADRRTDEELDELRLHLATMQSSTSNLRLFAQADTEFHIQVARMSGNEVLLNIATSLGALLRVWGERVAEASSDLDAMACEHLPILTGIADQDGPAARAAMEAHLRLASARLIAVVDPD